MAEGEVHNTLGGRRYSRYLSRPHLLAEAAHTGWSEPQAGGLLLAFDRLFTIEDWRSLHLKLGLAVLSGCETGLPGTALPDEVIGLPTALAEAGAAGVVASLWSVADESTAQLMGQFYKLWQQDKLTLAEALRRAQINLREQGYAHPYFWGAFTCTGV